VKNLSNKQGHYFLCHEKNRAMLTQKKTMIYICMFNKHICICKVILVGYNNALVSYVVNSFDMILKKLVPNCSGFEHYFHQSPNSRQ
jgi:hypothetical protein